MKTSLLIWILTATAVALLAANWQVRRPRAANADAALPAEENATTPAKTEATAEPSASAPSSASTVVPHPVVKWETIESSDYKQYVSRLRSVGFPEELIRSIVIADMNKLYESREQALKLKPVPYDAPFLQRQTNQITGADWDRVKQLWQLQIQKQTALQDILSCYVPREILRTPRSLNYESYEYAIGLLSEEKRNAVQLIQEGYVLDEAISTTSMTNRPAELENYKRLRAERDAAMLRTLTPEELDRFNMNTTPAGTELARRVIGMEPTDEEFETMFKIVYKNWLDTGGVYGRWRAIRVPPEQIAAADQEMNATLRSALGPDRFLDYQMASSETGQQLRHLGARYDLSRETLAQAFELQTQADQLSKARNIVSFSTDGGKTVQSPAQRLQELQSQLQQVLGPVVWSAWQDGRYQKVNLDP